jgi:hypothetical protein
MRKCMDGKIILKWNLMNKRRVRVDCIPLCGYGPAAGLL